MHSMHVCTLVSVCVCDPAVDDLPSPLLQGRLAIRESTLYTQCFSSSCCTHCHMSSFMQLSLYLPSFYSYTSLCVSFSNVFVIHLFGPACHCLTLSMSLSLFSQQLPFYASVAISHMLLFLHVPQCFSITS